VLERDETKRFSFGWLFTVRAWLGLAIVTLGPLSITIAGAIERVGAAIVFGSLLQLAWVVLALNLVVLLSRISRVAVISPSGVEAWNFLGKRTILMWANIDEVRELDIWVFGQRIPQLRLRGGAGRVIIGLDGRMPGFEELADAIRANTVGGLRRGDERPWWQRVFIPT
jgi:hypothetical protein